MVAQKNITLAMLISTLGHATISLEKANPKISHVKKQLATVQKTKYNSPPPLSPQKEKNPPLSPTNQNLSDYQ